MNDKPDESEPTGFDPGQAQRFLNALITGELEDLFLEIRVLPHAGGSPKLLYFPDKRDVSWKDIAQANAAGYSITVAAGLRSRRGGKKEDVGALAALWADLDSKQFGGSKRAAEKLAATALLKQEGVTGGNDA